MFEPLSAMTVLGFVTGTLAFIVTTISRLDERTHEIRECEDRLNSFNFQLEDASMELKVWHWIWIGKEPFPDKTYSHFWSPEGVKSIRARVDSITELSSQIESILHQSADCGTGRPLRRSDLKDWSHLIGHDVLSWRYAEREKASLVRKVAFALFHNATLLEKIDRLKAQIEGLRNFSQYQFRLKHNSDPYQRPTRAELRQISDLKKLTDQISIFQRVSWKAPSHWAIELTPPEAGHALDWYSEMAEAHIDFLVRHAPPDVQPKAIRLRLCLNEQLLALDTIHANIIDKIDYIVLNRRRDEEGSGYDQCFELLEAPRRSRSLTQIISENLFSGHHRKSFEVERASLLHGLGHWMVLLWETSWSFNLCNCKIRCISLADACTRHSLSRYGSKFPFGPKCHHAMLARDDFKPSPFARDDFEPLGVALAEIALSLPIGVTSEGEDGRYSVSGDSVSRNRLLCMLRERYGRNTITKAVSYCLDSRSRNSIYSSEDFGQHYEDIILPLQSYHDIVLKHCQTASGKRLRSEEDKLRYLDESADSSLTDPQIE